MSSSAKAVQLLLADNAVLRAGLRTLIERLPDLAIAGEAATALDAARLAAQLQPDVVVMEFAIPGGGVRTIADVLAAAPRTRVLVFTNDDDPSLVPAALEAGARGFCLKQAPGCDIVACIRAVHAGDVVVYPPPAGRHKDRLSRREVQVLEGVARGMTSREISGALGIGVKTVETYRLRLAHKLGLSRRSDFVEYALEAGLLGQPRRRRRRTSTR